MSDDTRRRIAAVFGLTLLEVLQSQDRPDEVLEDEDVSITMPRRLGLSEVVDRQIRNYRDAVRKRRRMSDAEARDLVQLVVRRPDAEDVFRVAGAKLAGGDGATPGRLRRALPRGLAFGLVRRRVRKRLKSLFGRRIGGFAPGPFALEGRGLIFINTDPGGDACHFLTGLAQVVVRESLGDAYRVVHSQCQGRADGLCRWTVTSDVRVREREQVGELLLGPELETG